jgi:hypothetical protein
MTAIPSVAFKAQKHAISGEFETTLAPMQVVSGYVISLPKSPFCLAVPPFNHIA